MTEKQERLFRYAKNFQLESGEHLAGFQLKYYTYGEYEKNKPVLWVCHALTGHADISEWWAELFSPDSPLAAEKFFIITVNTLGSCYGSTGPLSENPATGKPYFHSFPLITHRDVVRAFDLLRQELGIEKIHTLIGGSIGGQQTVEWAIMQPKTFEHIIPIACNAKHSPWGIAWNEAQRMAIEADTTWKENHEEAGLVGMRAARASAMLSFRSYAIYQATQEDESKLTDFRAASYQQYQGKKLADRFNAFSYWTLTKMMDNHDVGRSRKSIIHALQSIRAKTLVVGIDSDVLFPIAEQQFLANHIPQAKFHTIHSPYGHDGFLVEQASLKKAIRAFYRVPSFLLAIPS